ncbi:MAG: low molecular weight protein-tyrosine-phosphatase [Candidatus Berkiella sp.]
MKNKPVGVLFVCTANYCRSPTAEVIFDDIVEKANLAEYFLIDSAGTHGVFAGSAPDPRAQAMAKRYGLKMQHIVSRQITLNDFHEFDYIVAMDHSNLAHLQAICPSTLQHKIALLLSYANDPITLEVPDPYSGGEQGFLQVYELIVNGAQGLLAKIKNDHQL